MRILFFGEDSFSVIVLDSIVKAGHEVVATFCPIYNNNIFARLQRTCELNRIHFERIKDFNEIAFTERIHAMNVDVAVICHFQKILNRKLFELPKYGSINLHPSLLPQYRGMAPQHWPIINGEQETGITVHFVAEAVDAGDIIIQKKISIENDMYVFDLQNKMKFVYRTIVKDALDIIESRKGSYINQSSLKGSYYGRLKESDCIITEKMNTQDAYNLIRGVSFPYFGARVENYIVWKAQILEADSGVSMIQQNKKFGVVFTGNDKYLRLADGTLKIEKSEIYEK